MLYVPVHKELGVEYIDRMHLIQYCNLPGSRVFVMGPCAFLMESKRSKLAHITCHVEIQVVER